ncbi:MAG: hypothetical protein HeimC2_07400 [Candidatus Heimdallarchaeota archaeon LC_2]|nr:MAG: hypothetical protein HeimC2_07400 [Candidatus Heimdallarchaeota archaeon LC_2]
MSCFCFLKIITHDIHNLLLLRQCVCRNLKPLFNFDPPATEEEIYDASIQFIRKISGFTKPSKVNQEVFDSSVKDTTHVVKKMLESLITKSPLKNRELEAEKVRKRFEKNLKNLRN